MERKKAGKRRGRNVCMRRKKEKGDISDGAGEYMCEKGG